MFDINAEQGPEAAAKRNNAAPLFAVDEQQVDRTKAELANISSPPVAVAKLQELLIKSPSELHFFVPYRDLLLRNKANRRTN